MSYVQLKTRSICLASLLVGLALIGSACTDASPESTEASTPALGETSTTAPLAPRSVEEADDAGQSSMEGDPTASDQSPSPTVNASAEPLPVAFSEETAAASTAEIGPEGGEVRAVSGDGTTYVLTVPDGALLGSERITLTPISLETSPFEDAAVLGVSMEPDGLVFLAASALTISGHSFVPSTSVAFASDHDGSDFQAQLGTIGESTTLPVTHFSTAGLFEAAEAEVASIFDEYAPHSREGQHVQEIAVINRRVENPDARGAALSAVLASWFTEIDADASATTDESTAESLLGEFVNARSYVELLRASDDTSAIDTSVDEAMITAALTLQETASQLFDQRNLLCIQDREPDAMFAMLKWALLYTWLGGEITDNTSRTAEMGAAIKRCAIFRVEFVSHASAAFSSTVQASIPLEPPEDLNLNSGAFEYPTVRGVLNGQGAAGNLACTSQAPIDVAIKLHFNPVIGHLSDSEFDAAQIGIRFYEDTNWVCGGQPIQQALWLPFFATGFASYRTGEGFYAFDMQPSNDAGVWVDAEDASSSDGVHVTFDVDLIHEPQLP